jgi:hypothetical protein
MNKIQNKKNSFTQRMITRWSAVLLTLALANPFARAELGDFFNFGKLVKTLGIGAVVAKFGPNLNRQVNKLTHHVDTPELTTKVVPILRVGLGRANAIGAAQVMGPKHLVEQVRAVLQPEVRIYGALTIRALVPVSSKNVVREIKKVPGVGVSGILDLSL